MCLCFCLPTAGQLCLLDELLVLLRSEEAAKGIPLHQGVDAALGQVEGGSGKVNQIPQSHVFGEMVNVHLKSEGH